MLFLASSVRPALLQIPHHDCRMPKQSLMNTSQLVNWNFIFLSKRDFNTKAHVIFLQLWNHSSKLARVSWFSYVRRHVAPIWYVLLYTHALSPVSGNLLACCSLHRLVSLYRNCSNISHMSNCLTVWMSMLMQEQSSYSMQSQWSVVEGKRRKTPPSPDKTQTLLCQK